MSDWRTEEALRAEFVARIDRIIELGKTDPEESHADEDDLVLGLAYRWCPEWIVNELKRLQAAGLTRWYA